MAITEAFERISHYDGGSKQTCELARALDMPVLKLKGQPNTVAASSYEQAQAFRFLGRDVHEVTVERTDAGYRIAVTERDVVTGEMVSRPVEADGTPLSWRP